MKTSWTIFLAVLAGLSASVSSTMQASTTPLYSPTQRVEVMRYWLEGGRYLVGKPAEADREGVWQVRLTVEGSKWLWAYDRARGLGKVAPTDVAKPQDERQKVWDQWISEKIAIDRWRATAEARSLNTAVMGAALPPLPAVVPPIHPGPAPDDLVAFAGNPPPFAEAVPPKEHRISFDDGTVITYRDHVAMRPDYRYYRFEQGVMQAGRAVRNMAPDELDSLFLQAGMTPFERKVMAAVSLLEGGFESVNTYDTGFVSVGFIQFASLQSGTGSFGQKLARYKRDCPTEFQANFRRFGIDVRDSGEVVALDIDTGVELSGADAVNQIIHDKRLIAVFQRAGTKCDKYRICQLRTAKELYYPADDVITITVNGKIMSGKVGSIIQSEAGMATLMDRKVNTGTLEPITQVATKVATDKKINKFEDLAAYERELVALLRYRKDYLSDASLSQPKNEQSSRR